MSQASGTHPSLFFMTIRVLKMWDYVVRGWWETKLWLVKNNTGHHPATSAFPLLRPIPFTVYLVIAGLEKALYLQYIIKLCVLPCRCCATFLQRSSGSFKCQIFVILSRECHATIVWYSWSFLQILAQILLKVWAKCVQYIQTQHK